jgi:hypothetical protein
MARKLTGPKPGTSRTFVPDVFDNLADPEPITGEIATPTEAEKREIERERKSFVRFDDDGKPAHIEHPSDDEWTRRAVSAHVSGITNYEGPGGPIVTGDDLLAHGELEVIEAFANEVCARAVLSKGEIKNSVGSSGSPDLATSGAGQIVKIA